MRNLFNALTVLIILSVAGCANDLSSNNYDEAAVGQTPTVDSGVIVNAEKVKISGNKGVGVLAGGAAGAVGGSVIGGGTRANLLGAIGGGLVGAVIGNAADKTINSQEGMRYLIKLQDGHNIRETNVTSGADKMSVTRSSRQAKVIAIVQAAKPMLQVGQKVLVLEGGTERARVIADNG